MKCSVHPRAESTGTCARCGRPYCADCLLEISERRWCRECLGAAVQSVEGAHPGWTKLAAVLLSLIPGAGHMFLGLIGKGFALMALLIVSVFLVILYSDATGMYWVTAYLVPTLCVLFLSYAIFDTIAICDARRGLRSASSEDDDTMRAVWERVLLNRRTGGWILLAAGAVGVLHLFSEPLNRLLSQWLHASLPVTGLVIPVALLVIGILLLQKSRKGS